MRGLRRASARALAGATICVSMLGGTAAAQSTELAPEAVPVTTVQASLDKAIGLEAKGAIGKVVVSQPETIQVGQAADGLYVIGSQPGPANILVYDRQGRLTQRVDVNVGYDAQALREMLADALPGEPIVVKQLSSSLLLEGEVSRPSVAAIAEKLAQRVAPDAVISRLHARASQVRLDVRIVEVTSRGLKDISTAVSLANGSDISLTTGGVPVGADSPFGTAQVDTTSGRVRLAGAIRALQDRGELRVMAEPSLVALSGEKASFRAGGEFPFPTPEDLDKISIQFRPYGAGMTFKPTVLESGAIRVELEAELSDIDPSVALSVADFTVPGLKVRRAATAVDLRDGETFLIAGLFQDTAERQARSLPFLSKVPVLDRILRPIIDATRRRETHQELAILVTPHLDTPVDSPLTEAAVLDRTIEVLPKPPPSPKATSGLRGPPVRQMVAELKEALRPPARWLGQAARRFTATLLGRG